MFELTGKGSRAEPSQAENFGTHHYWIVHPCAYRARSKVRIIKITRLDVKHFFPKRIPKFLI